jgi:hypothetical protein
VPGLVDRLLEDDDVFDLRDEIEALGNVAQVFSQYGYTFNPRERRYEKIFPMNPAWTVGEGEGRFEWTALRVNVTPSGQTWFVVLRSGVGTPREWKFEASWDNLSSYKFQPDSSAPTVALSTVLHNVEQLMQERQSYTGRVQDFVSAFKRTLPVVEALVAHLLEDDVEVDADDISRAASVTEIDVLTLKELRSVFSRMGYTSSAYRRKTQDEVLISGTPSGPDRPVTRTDLNTVADRVKAILDRLCLEQEAARAGGAGLRDDWSQSHLCDDCKQSSRQPHQQRERARGCGRGGPGG